MKSNSLRQIAVIVAVLATIIINVLANALPLNGLSTGEISDRFEVFFVPAGYVFSIWGLIYLGLIAYAVFQALPANKDVKSLQDMGWLFVLSCIANIAWLFFWHYEQFILTIFAMLALLLLLIAIYERLWGVRQTASLLDFLGWSGWGISDAIWAMIMLIIAAIIGIVVILKRRDSAYGLVLVWAFVGIAIKHAGTATVSLTAWITAGVVFLLAMYRWFRDQLTAQP